MLHAGRPMRFHQVGRMLLLPRIQDPSSMFLMSILSQVCLLLPFCLSLAIAVSYSGGSYLLTLYIYFSQVARALQ